MTATLRRSAPQAGVAVVGCVMLLVRPWLWALGPPRWAVAAFFGVIGLAGVGLPARADIAVRLPKMAFVSASGMAVFTLARLLGPGYRALPHTGVGVGLAVLAAVAEEAFFRRFLYQFLLRAGVGVAIVGSAACFAAVHVGIYGAGVLPLDLAAGLIFSVQRWSTGTWLSPAATHVLANLLAIY